MTENNQQKIEKLKQRVSYCEYVANMESAIKQLFIADYFYKTDIEEKRVIIARCVDELSEEDLNSICSDTDIIDEFKKKTKGLDPRDL